MKHEELEIRAYGRVQGVRFREMAAKQAERLKLAGHVFNRGDGSVELVIQGEQKELEEFLRWIEGSPGLSRVTALQYAWRVPSQHFSAFQIVKDAGFVADQAQSMLNLGKTLLKQQRRGEHVPLHVVIIPDGNRRWARSRGLHPEVGHYTSASFQHLRELFDAAQRAGVKYLTLWGFSTENWKRDAKEREALFALILRGIEQFREEAEQSRIYFRHIGRKDRLPKALVKALEALEKETQQYRNFHVQFCLDYGGSDELVRAVNALLREGKKEIDEDALLQRLDSMGLPQIDLIIRTSGEQRLSGFMPLLSAYAELYFSPIHFPDFTAAEFQKALAEYSERQRRFGG